MDGGERPLLWTETSATPFIDPTHSDGGGGEMMFWRNLKLAGVQGPFFTSAANKRLGDLLMHFEMERVESLLVGRISHYLNVRS